MYTAVVPQLQLPTKIFLVFAPEDGALTCRFEIDPEVQRALCSRLIKSEIIDKNYDPPTLLLARCLAI